MKQFRVNAINQEFAKLTNFLILILSKKSYIFDDEIMTLQPVRLTNLHKRK